MKALVKQNDRISITENNRNNITDDGIGLDLNTDNSEIQTHNN